MGIRPRVEFISLQHLPASGVRGGRKARSVEFLRGAGTMRGFLLKIEAGGKVGPKRAAAGQLWVPLHGSGWIASADGVKWRLQAGHAVFIPKGEMYVQGTEKGVMGLLVQVDDMRQLVSTA